METKKIKISLITVLFIIAIVIIAALVFMVFGLSQKNKENENKISQMQNNNATIQNTTHTNKNNNTNTTTNTITQKDKEYIIDTTDKNAKYEEYNSEIDEIEGIYLTEAIENNDGTYTLRGVEISYYTFDEDLLDQYKEDGYITLNGIKYILEGVAGGREEVLFRLTEEGKDESLYEIIQEGENLYKLERMAQLTDVYQFTENLVEITIDSNTNIYNDLEEEIIPHDPITVENQLSDYKSKTLKLTKEDILERVINSDDMGSCFKIIFDQNGKVNNLETITLGM